MAVCAVGVLGLRAFVCDLFRVNSSSMAPSVWPGEVVLVAYDRSRPERLEPIVVDYEDEFVTKRAAGIGGTTGEDILIDSHGDLRVDGHYLPPSVKRPRVLLFDQVQHAVDEHFARGSSRGDPWQEHDGVLTLDAREIGRGEEAGMLRYHPRLRDHYLDSTGRLVEGLASVSDAAIGLQVRVTEPGGVLRVALLEEADTFLLVVELEDGGAHVSLLRSSGREAITLAESTTNLRPGTWVDVALANIDNHLTATFDDVDLAASYERNTPTNGAAGERLKVGGAGCLIEVRDLRVWRDLHYTGRGQYAVGRRFTLEAGKIFLLGDNSASSLDSREYGAIDEGRVVGRPVMVVWPPSAIRWLR
jgi:hypothetical protein